MNRATPQMRDFAARLLAHEAARARTADPGVAASFAIPDQMKTPIATLMGNGGQRALLMRTVALAAAEVPWLKNCRVAADGSLEGPDPPEVPADPAEVIEGGVVLGAQLIGLLVAFIGEGLTLQLVREVWPKLPAKDLKFKL
jgi:hypothetical protein